MGGPFLLCDPALVTPPEPSEDIKAARDFWVQLIEWSGDRRVRLGPECRGVVVDRITAFGWPDFRPPACPRSLAGMAAERLTVMLTAVGVVDDEACGDLSGDVPDLDPAYVGSGDGGLALAMDLRTGHCRALVGVATRQTSWADARAATVDCRPPPPKDVPLVHEPNAAARGERDVYAGVNLHGRRLSIVGHRVDAKVYKELEKRLGWVTGAIRWIECEKGHKPPLEPLKGMQSDRDLLCCLTGHIGHAGSQKALGIAKKCGVAAICVDEAREITDALVARYGDAP